MEYTKTCETHLSPLKDWKSLVRGDKTHSYEKITCNAKQQLISADNKCGWVHRRDRSLPDRLSRQYFIENVIF